MSGEEDDYENELDDKELIVCVKSNSFLYDKSDKRYSDVELKTLLGIIYIGEQLSKPKTGAEAEHRFFQLRQRFGRERRKVLLSEPRSGAGAGQGRYVPQWNLYNELLFLIDVIKHRKTTSNYKRKNPTCETQQMNFSTTSQPSTSTPLNKVTSNIWNEDLIVLSPDDVSDNSTVSDSLILNQSSFANSSFTSNLESGRSPVGGMQTSNICGKRVAESDGFKTSFSNRKKQDCDIFSQSIVEQSKKLDVLAQKVGNALSVTTQPSSTSFNVLEPLNSLRPDVKALLTSIGFALQTIPESKQLDFLITVLQLLKQYTENTEKTDNSTS